MFSDDEIKESSLMRPGDEIISIREVCLIDKYDKKYMGSEPLLSNSNRNDLEVPRLFRDGFFSEGLDSQARFAWTEEDGNLASLVSEPGFGTGQTAFGKDFDAELSANMKDVATSTSLCGTNRNVLTTQNKSRIDAHPVSSTSSSTASGPSLNQPKGKNTHKVDKTDPRSRYHYVKYVKRHGRTVKLWECGICSREFQHQYTLMRHLPTHTDERNFHCDECAKSFRQLSTLSQHRAIHSAERPYACEVCNKTFNRVSTLISHRKTHSDEKPYKCHICPKGFHQKGNLRNHLFTHTNERPYRCNICMKGFNQQSNLVCHKNKAHPDESSAETDKSKNAPNISVRSAAEIKTDSKRPPSEHCEVTSTVGPYLPVDQPTSWHKPIQWDLTKAGQDSSDIWNESPWGSNGVIVDPIKTYHMGIALATRQTPFALLKSDSGTPVLVKVVDTNMPGGKQMLVPATAEDLKIGGKIVLDNESATTGTQEVNLETPSDVNSAVQIRVPVVATVVPKIKPGGKLQLSVEEPHHAYQSSLSSNYETKPSPCTSASSSSTTFLQLLEPLRRLQPSTFNEPIAGRSCSPPASSPLDLISLDLFEPIGCIPLGKITFLCLPVTLKTRLCVRIKKRKGRGKEKASGRDDPIARCWDNLCHSRDYSTSAISHTGGPQITSVDNMEQPPPSEDSDIFIEKFQEIIPLSDSD